MMGIYRMRLIIQKARITSININKAIQITTYYQNRIFLNMVAAPMIDECSVVACVSNLSEAP